MSGSRSAPSAEALGALGTLFALILLVAGSCAGPAGAARAAEVMSWVPPNAIDECKATLEASYGSYSAKDGLTRIGLQLWVPTAAGGVSLATRYGTIASADIAWFRDWGAANGVKVLLCVFNGERGWDWDLAAAAFRDHRAAFVEALVAEVERHGLDGVDVDLEGTVDSAEQDRAPFRLFLKDHSAALRARKKLLTVDSFHSPCWNAPNMSWWADWVGLVDGIHSMGYEDLYEGSTVTFAECVPGERLFRYSFQQSYGVRVAGHPPAAVLMGLPSHVGRWGSGGRGPTALDHVLECALDLASPAGVAIFDLRLADPAWRTPEVWAALAALKKGSPTRRGRLRAWGPAARSSGRGRRAARRARRATRAATEAPRSSTRAGASRE